MKSPDGHHEFIARESLIFLIPLMLMAVIFWFYDLNTLSTFFLFSALLVGFFFRNPERNSPKDPDYIISSADGRVMSVDPQIAMSPLGNGPYTRVSVFMSVFNVHINRWPASGKILRIKHFAGSFLDARDADSSTLNERNAVLVQTSWGAVEVVQIAGKIARRIACWARESDDVVQGARMGLIRFGSRVDLYFPPTSTVLVNTGDKVRAGISVIAKVNTIKPE